jgi:hypothetical protein
MARPQFTLRAILFSVGYLAACLGCLRAAVIVGGGLTAAALLLGAILCFGAGVGAIVERPFVGAAMAIYCLGLFVIAVVSLVPLLAVMLLIYAAASAG